MQAVLYGPTGLPLTPVTAAIVDPTFAALRVSTRPLEYNFPGNVLGHYRASLISGAVAASGANGPIASLRWGDSSRFLVLYKIVVSAVVSAAVTAQVTDIDAIVARAFTASDTGGTALTLTGQNQKARVTMGSSLITDLRVSTTAALGAGTRTLDAQPFSSASIGSGSPGMTTVGAASPIQELYRPDVAAGEHPLVLHQNEGVIIRTPTSIATGSIKFYINLMWAEVAVF